MKVILVRHGQTEHNLPSSTGHAGNDSPLNELGVEQAQAAAESIKSEQPTIVYSSPFLRCKQTAKFIAERCSVNMNIEPALKEFDMGNWADLPAEEAKQLLVKNGAWSFTPQKYTFRVPGGESWEDVRYRAEDLLRQLNDRHANDAVVLVSHNQTIRALIGILTQKPFENWFGFPIDNGSIRIFDYTD